MFAEIEELEASATQFGEFELQVDCGGFRAHSALVEQKGVAVADPGFFDCFVCAPGGLVEFRATTMVPDPTPRRTVTAERRIVGISCDLYLLKRRTCKYRQ